MPRPLRPTRRPSAPPFPRGWRFVTAAFLCGFGLLAIRGGAESIPWMANLAAMLDFPRGHGPRLLAGTLFALAAMMTLAPSWSRKLAFVSAGVLVFAGLATVSAIRSTRSAGPDGPGLSGLEALAVAGVAIVAAGFGAFLAIRAQRSIAPPSRGLSVAWRIAAAFVALGGGLAIAAPSAPDRRPSPAPTAVAMPIERPASEPETIDLDVAAWTGRSVAEISIAAHLPELVAAAGDGGPLVVVLYSGRCSTCHDLFRERFAGEHPHRVIAVEIPPAADATLAAGDDLGEIECVGCERWTLPAGPRWLVRPPTVVRIEAGVVACVDDASTGACFTP